MSENYTWYPDDYQKDLVIKKEESTEGSNQYSFSPNGKGGSQKKKGGFLKKSWVIAVLSSVVTSVFCFGIFASVFMFAFDDMEIDAGDNSQTTQNVDGGKYLSSDVDKTDGNSMTIPEIAAKVGPSVVGITSRGNGGPGNENVNLGSGSGIIISDDGYILTNNHVIEGASELLVILNTKKEYKATLVGTDPRTDLAVLKIEATNLPAATLGSSAETIVGEPVVAIGNPLGQELAGSVTDGIISAINRTMKVDDKTLKLLQTNAAINPGNSGGALVNAYGEVIGINTVKVTGSTVEGLGFSIPVDEAKPIINDLIEHGYVQGRPLVGIRGRDVTEDISKQYGLPVGIYVAEVIPFSAAEQAGIKANDVIVKVGDEKITSFERLNQIRDEHKTGDKLVLTIARDKEILTIDLILGEDKTNAPASTEENIVPTLPPELFGDGTN